MKAEHRHELHTNALANQLGKLYEGVKNAPQSNATVIYVVVIVAVALAIAVFFASGSTGGSELWVKLEEADSTNDVRILDAIASGNPGTVPGRTARFDKARLLLQTGLRNLFTVDRSRAIQSLEDARQAFNALSVECEKKELLLAQEALMGAAQAEESLIGIAKEDKSGDRGSLERARELYAKLAESSSDSIYATTAAARLEEIKTSGPSIEKFYKELNVMADVQKKRTPAPGDVPPIPPAPSP